MTFFSSLVFVERKTLVPETLYYPARAHQAIAALLQQSVNGLGACHLKP
jgi:hypothetical protein